MRQHGNYAAIKTVMGNLLWGKRAGVVKRTDTGKAAKQAPDGRRRAWIADEGPFVDLRQVKVARPTLLR